MSCRRYRVYAKRGAAIGLALLSTSPALSLREIEEFVKRGEKEHAYVEKEDSEVVRALELIERHGQGRHGDYLLVEEEVNQAVEYRTSQPFFVVDDPHDFWLVLNNFDPVQEGVDEEDWEKYKRRYLSSRYVECKREEKGERDGERRVGVMWSRMTAVRDVIGVRDKERLREKERQEREFAERVRRTGSLFA